MNGLEYSGPEAPLRLLKSYFRRNEILLCNENKELPSLVSVGGDWNSIVSMIGQGEVFYSKLYKGRVTYLSPAFYHQIKRTKQRMEKVSPTGRRIFEFLHETGIATTAEIKNILMLSGKTFSAGMDELFRELLVTAIKRDRTINDSLSSFYWGTAEKWEQLHPAPEAESEQTNLTKLLSSMLTERQIRSLLR